MKLFSIFMLFFVLGTHATSYSQKQRVSLNLKQCDINTLFQEIWKQTGLRFVYNEKDVADLQRLDIQATQETVKEVLDNIFRDTPLQCKMESDVIYITSLPSTPQTKKEMVKLTGTVKDKTGSPLPGVTVFLGDSNIGTSTDIYGHYQLSILKGETVEIVYSFIGMKKVTYTFSAETDMKHDVLMVEDNVKLQDVVVIGYGAKSKRDVTSSISSVKSEDLEKFANGTTTFDNMLGGAIKGVLVTQHSGEPGNKATINVRGITSPVSGSSNEPLYVIDGVPFFLQSGVANINPLTTISPNDIESIDVLKDAAATAIYGSRGANGVVIINTKNGRRNEKMTISAGYTLTAGNPIKKYDALNTAEFKEVQDLLIRNSVEAYNKGQISDDYWYGWVDYAASTLGNISTNESGKLVYGGLNQDAFGTTDTDWQKEILNKNALTHQYSLGIRGGSSATSWAFSFNATDQEGLFIRDDMQSYGTRLSLDSDISKRFKAGASLNYSYSKRLSGRNTDQMYEYTRAWLVRPDVPIYDKDGELVRMDNLDGASTSPNPVAEYKGTYRSYSNQFIGSSYLSAKILDNLKITGDINIALFDSHNYTFSPLVTQYVYTGFEDETYSNASDGRSRVANTSINFRADYELQRNGHKLNLMAGYGWDRNFYESLGLSFRKFPDDDILNNIASAGECDMKYANESKVKTGLNSIYARASYNYLDKYLAELNFRTDVSSKFGPGNRRAYFPALSLGWRISSENFMADIEKIDDIKLRFSYGQTGSTNIDDFLYRQFFESGGAYYKLNTIVPSSSLPNLDVKWEMTTEYNGGIDFAFFERRLFGSIDGYYRFTDGALCPSPFPSESGASSYYSNLIDLSNKGLEVEIGGDIIRSKEVTWTSKFNISFNRNKIEKLNGATLWPGDVDSFIEGYPSGSMKGYVVEKIFQDQKEVDALNANAVKKGYPYYQASGTSVGDYKFKDLNHDGRINSDDREVIATSEPKFFGGFFNSVSYKNFNLSFVFQFSQGAKAELGTLREDMGGTIGKSIYRETFRNTWTPEHTDAKYARLVSTDPNYNSRTSDKYVFETSYLRLKNIGLSYSVPQNLLRQFNIQSVVLFANASNIWTLTKWPGLDPEMTSNITLSRYTQNNDMYPLSKNFTVGVKIEF